MAKDKVNEDARRTSTNAEDAENQIPESARTNGEREGRGVRTPTVGVTEERSFNERTAVRQPFILEDGTQDNGAKDLKDQDAAQGESTRKGNQTVREDTRDAIEKLSLIHI